MSRYFEIILPNRGKNSHKILGYINSNGCWLCTTLSKDHDGYVKIHYDDIDTRLHRVVYKVFIGQVTDNELIRHKCDNPGCCNPDHLQVGTAKDNSRDMIERGRVNRKRVQLSTKIKKAIARSTKTIPELAEENQVCFNTIVYARRKFRKAVKDRMAPSKTSVPLPNRIKKTIKKASSN
jgi:hypothetical protein